MPWSKEKDFREKLSKLSESQQSIQTLSHWVAFHKANAAHAANVWADEAQRAADPHRQLLLVYLANDVMQNSRRKGTPCADAFASQMATVLPAAHAAATPTVRAKLERLLSIWEERAVMPAPQVAEVRAALGGEGPPPASAPAVPPDSQQAAGLQAGGQQKRPRPADDAGAGGGGGGGGGGGSTVPLLQALERLTDDSSLDVVAAERDKVDVVAIERGEAAPAEVAAATSLLAGQRKRLATELEQRRQLILALAAACEAQHACCAKLQASAGEAEALVARIEAWQGA